MTTFELSVRFFLELAAILTACRVVSWIGVRFGQPPVVGEMIAGVCLGPSLLGHFFPEAQAYLFPPDTKPLIFAGAQLGLALYMFCVGLEFRVDLVKQRAKSAFAISASGILAPFALGCAIAWWLHGKPGFFGPTVTLNAALPYLGASMAITAFPMLARIIVERKLTGTRTGALALASGAIDDAAAWCVLAIVLAGMAGKPFIAVAAIGGGILVVVFLLTLGRRALGWLAHRAENDERLWKNSFTWVLVLLVLAAWFTDTIGLYAVFGAFFLGTAVPRGRFCDRLQTTIEPLTVSLLLPMFFIYSGLNTRFDLVNEISLWGVALVVLAAAILGKAGACYLAARACGESHADSLGVGTLMNARGLMELIILNIGLERGLITPTLFTILVFMAIATTLMTTPMFNAISRGGRIKPA